MLEVTDLSKRYGDVVALDGCSLTVERGRMLGFLGPNGAGKTTAMRAVFGLVAVDRGAVRWDGRPIDRAARRGFGYMPEQRGLYPKMKVGEQLVWLARLHGAAAGEAEAATQRWLEVLGLTDRAGDELENLSHGNQQRVQLAAALVHDPDLLVLDEPFSGLDPIGAEMMASVLRERAAAGAAVLFSSHQLDVVEGLYEDVAIIHRGRVVLMGDIRELKTRSPHRIVEVELTGDAGALLARLEGVVSASFDGRRHRVVVDADADVRDLLAEADRDAGVQHLAYSTPSLSELFKEAVS
jgi:ABC-2 type transport system ATP-binding protein